MEKKNPQSSEKKKSSAVKYISPRADIVTKEREGPPLQLRFEKGFSI